MRAILTTIFFTELRCASVIRKYCATAFVQNINQETEWRVWNGAQNAFYALFPHTHSLPPKYKWRCMNLWCDPSAAAHTSQRHMCVLCTAHSYLYNPLKLINTNFFCYLRKKKEIKVSSCDEVARAQLMVKHCLVVKHWDYKTRNSVPERIKMVLFPNIWFIPWIFLR